MEFRQWVDEAGGIDEAAALLKEKPRTVYSWYRLEKTPRLEAALNIVIRSRHRVDFNGIYGPLAKARIEPK
ncbi:hypothetical protein [Halomonas sp. OfavH-34-E]|uniref:hypothetical protein n=1 Tax=Halomonas sp. OfavH-34-E TaxID=2954491 RepID=UPI0020970A68|nr:hypothetical protein [Halomonas sp. OfavH-34-E]MCO7217096.1 hypothetical protein [Halomonas sp. OfavH-34-E]